jgi:radical SAM-linked protein
MAYITNMSTDNVPRSRMRLKFARLEGAGNMSHLEQIKALRDLAAASGLDCWPAKHGRNVVPKMAFGPALSSGYGSRCEYADLYLAQSCKEDVVQARLASVGSGAFKLLSVKRVPVHFPSIEASVGAVRYLIAADFGNFSQESVDAFFKRESAMHVKVNSEGLSETVDVRPLVMAVELNKEAGELKLMLRLVPGKNIKPGDALCVIAGAEMEIRKIVREELYWLDSKGGLEII